MTQQRFNVHEHVLTNGDFYGQIVTVRNGSGEPEYLVSILQGDQFWYAQSALKPIPQVADLRSENAALWKLLHDVNQCAPFDLSTVENDSLRWALEAVRSYFGDAL